jgi:hypothetical protein
MTPSEILRSGSDLLESILVPEGFSFVATGGGSSSGGEFASGEFRTGNRRLELHFRFSLGLVTYHVGAVALSHDEYVRAVRALDQVATSSSFPGFSDDWAPQFQALADDLRCFGERFLRGSADGFAELQAWLVKNPKPTGFAAV